MLSLSKIQKGHYGCLFVLGRIAFEDLIDEPVILLCELEGDAGIILRGITMLELKLSVAVRLPGKSFQGQLTTCSASLATLGLAVKARHCDREAIRTGRKAVLKT
jgi:hypothetical protein